MRRQIAAAALAALLPAALPAQEGAPLEAEVSADIAAEPAQVWDMIGDFQEFTWHPAVHSQTGEGGNEAGATRLLVLGEEGGPTIAEELDAYDGEAMRYAYRITEVDVAVLPVTSYASELGVAPGPDGGATVTWRASFERGDPGADPAPELNDETAIAAVTGIYEAGMQALVEEFGRP